MNARSYLALPVVILLGMLVAGCLPLWESTLPDLIILQLDREHSPAFVGFYAAYDRGFYSQKRLEVVIKNGGPGMGNPIDLVLSGYAQFGISTGPDLVTAYAEGKPVVAVSALSNNIENDTGIYETVLFTSRQLLERNRDLVERFMISSLRGWNFAFSYPELAADMVLRADPTLEYDNVEREWNTLRRLINPGVPYGLMDESVWETTIEILETEGALGTNVNPDELYTNEFLYCGDEEVDIYECW